METVQRRQAERWRALGLSLSMNLFLPLVVYYVLRARDVAQWQALLLSGAVPAVHALATALVRRRVEFFDVLVVVLLAVSAGLSASSGSPRVMLLKDAAIPAVLGLWIGGTLFAARPFAYHIGCRLRGPDGAQSAERVWRELPEFRAALRGLTALWGGAQLLDAALSVVWALELPVDLAPVVGRIHSFALLGAMVALTALRSRAFNARFGTPLFGVRAPVASQVPSGAPVHVADDAMAR
ncbi:VC0807 family protein [Streptomyces natalensis]|uniref:VC0807 family protein n=1 Tax=Streptomyces natalensis TaxID=68242 RepID=UPI000AE7FBDD|nr:VC0807 family protein [Streptomyces natalensis]